MSRLVDEDGIPMNDWDDINACQQRPPIKSDTRVPDAIPPALHDAYRQVLKEAEKIWLERQGQYGLTPFHRDPAVLEALIQVKLWRLEEGEGDMTDTYLDILNYAAIGLMVARGEWRE